MEISAEKTRLMTNSANGIQREIKVKGQVFGYCNKLQVPWGSFFQMMAPNQRFSQGLHKPLQLLQSWSPFGEITTYLLDQRWSWYAPLSFPYFCMPVNHGPWLQSKRKERRLLRWDATGGYWTFHIRTMWPMRRFAERSKQPLENMTNSWPWSRNES